MAFRPACRPRSIQRLAADAALAALVGDAIYDAPPERAPDDAAPDYVTLGEESVRGQRHQDQRRRDPRLHGDRAFGAGRLRRREADRRRRSAPPGRRAAGARRRPAGGAAVPARQRGAGAGAGERRVALRFRAVVDQDTEPVSRGRGHGGPERQGPVDQAGHDRRGGVRDGGGPARDADHLQRRDGGRHQPRQRGAVARASEPARGCAARRSAGRASSATMRPTSGRGRSSSPARSRPSGDRSPTSA